MNLDNSQIIIKNKLDILAQKLEIVKPEVDFKKNLFNFFKSPEVQNEFYGFYIYGDVGRGKTMLMKNFYEKITNLPKIYFHFNSFMILIHKYIMRNVIYFHLILQFLICHHINLYNLNMN